MSDFVLPGKLYICPTPIGNLKDITLRTLEVLQNVDLIACEDTRDSGKLLDHYGIHAPRTSYHDHNRTGKGPIIIEKLRSGMSVALISDAGMPGISDPGEDIVRLCAEEGIPYEVLPGACAGITALVASGLPTGRFVFEGFLPKQGKERRERLEVLSMEHRTAILYESPHHLIKTLEDLSNLPGKRGLTIIRELTKKFEEIIYTTPREALEIYREKEPRGEYVLILSGLSPEDAADIKKEEYKDMPLADHVAMYESQGHPRNEAMKMAAKDLGISKREVYAQLNRD